MDRTTRSILLVDESASMLFYLGMLLKRLEYKVETARSVEEALVKIGNDPPSLVVTEIILDGMKVIHLLERLKGDKHPRPIPVIVLTAESDPEMRDTCLQLGCAAYLYKPVEPNVLYRTIQSVSEALPRAHIRLKTSIRVTIGDDTPMGGAARDEQAIALSEGGLYVRTSYPQPQNAVTPVCIRLPDREVRAKAVVLYTYPIPIGPYQEPGMGMKFIELSDADRAAIRKFIKENLTKDIQPGKTDVPA